MEIKFRFATFDDCALLAKLNHQLIQDEGHHNRMNVPELEQRMRGWLAGEYRAVIYEESDEGVAYALFPEQPDEIYLRQLFVVSHRRSQGIGRRAVARQGFVQQLLLKIGTISSACYESQTFVLDECPHLIFYGSKRAV